MQESSPNKKRSGRSNGRSNATKSRRPKSAPSNDGSAAKPETRNSILARLDLLDSRLSEALATESPKTAEASEQHLAAANERVLAAVANQGAAISQIALALQTVQDSLAEMTPQTPDSNRGSIIAAFEQPEPTRPDPPSAAPEPNESNEDTQTQSWEDIKEAMLGTASESDASTEEQPESVSHEEEILFDFVSQADVDQLDEDGLRTLIIDQERIISRLVRRVQQKSRKELQLSPEQLHDCAKNLPEELAVRVETTLKTLDEQARLGELELSLERARISRQLSHLAETREIIEANARSLGLEIGPEGKIEGDMESAKRGGSKSRRWLGALGFGD